MTGKEFDTFVAPPNQFRDIPDWVSDMCKHADEDLELVQKWLAAMTKVFGSELHQKDKK